MPSTALLTSRCVTRIGNTSMTQFSPLQKCHQNNSIREAYLVPKPYIAVFSICSLSLFILVKLNNYSQEKEEVARFALSVCQGVRESLRSGDVRHLVHLLTRLPPPQHHSHPQHQHQQHHLHHPRLAGTSLLHLLLPSLARPLSRFPSICRPTISKGVHFTSLIKTQLYKEVYLECEIYWPPLPYRIERSLLHFAY